MFLQLREYFPATKQLDQSCEIYTEPTKTSLMEYTTKDNRIRSKTGLQPLIPVGCALERELPMYHGINLQTFETRDSKSE